MSPWAILASTAARWPERVVLASREGRQTYRALLDAVARRAGTLLARGGRAGERVGLLMANRPAWLEWFFAVSRIGAVAVPLNPAYTARELGRVLTTARLRLLVGDPDLVSRFHETSLPPADVIAADDASGPPVEPPSVGGADAGGNAAVIFYSSGSTGDPKGIVHSPRNLELIVESVRRNWRMGPEDAVLVAMPLAFVYASIVECLTAVRVGATVVLQERFDAAEAVERIRAGEVSVIMGVPAMYRTLLAASAGGRAPGGRLRACASAGETLPPELARAFEDRFGCSLLDFYGLTEAPHVAGHTPGRDRSARPKSCGRALPGVATRVVDEAGVEVATGEVGELLLKAPWLFCEYFADPAATAAALRDGWFATGDLVRLDEDGYLYVVDRKKELIKRSGFNVIPAEVEEVVGGIPGVAEAAAAGVADEQRGERVKVWVVRVAGSTLSADDIVARCREALATYKVPDAVEFVTALPKGPTGKIDRKALRARATPERAVSASPVPPLRDAAVPVAGGDGTRLAAYRFGGDGPALVLAHATGFHAHVWEPLLGALRRRFTVYAWDLRGHGESERGADLDAFRYEALGRDLLAVADHFGLGRVLALGHSVGGAVVVQAEVLRPGTVERAVLFEPIILPPGVTAPTQRVAAAKRRRRVFASTAEMLERWAGRPPFASFDPEALRAYVEHGVWPRPDGGVELKCSLEAEVWTFLQDVRSDLWARLGEYRTPTLVLAGDRSDSRAAPLAERQAARMADARAERVTGLSHFLPFERPGAMAARAIAFLLDGG